jgi:hypothetical protein
MTKSKPKTKRTSTPESKPKPKPVTVARLKRAIEGRNARALVGLYAEDAVVQVIDRDNPPSKPRNLEGMSAISAYFDDVYGRDMTHRIESGIAVGKRLAFTQGCAYPDRTRVFCSLMLSANSWDERMARAMGTQPLRKGEHPMRSPGPGRGFRWRG